jgi:preprotein translocase subunit SecA
MTSLIDPSSQESSAGSDGTPTRAQAGPPAQESKKLHLPSKPHVSAGWKIPGVATYKVNQWLEQTRAVNAWESRRRELKDGQIRKEALSLVYRAKSGETLESLLPETYSLVREAGRRALNMRHYDVQILGGNLFVSTVVFRRCKPGEGKTLTATLPLDIAFFGWQRCTFSNRQ